MPNRGLEVLLDAFEGVNRDVELHVYSSNIIYGKAYADSVNHDHLFNRCRSMKNVVYHGFAANKAVRLALQNANIFTYPSIFPETSCLAAIEAGAAGCRILTTDYAALPETVGGWAFKLNLETNQHILADVYRDHLIGEIDRYDPNNRIHRLQSETFNLFYSWEHRKHEWYNFFEELK